MVHWCSSRILHSVNCSGFRRNPYHNPPHLYPHWNRFLFPCHPPVHRPSWILWPITSRFMAHARRDLSLLWRWWWGFIGFGPTFRGKSDPSLFFSVVWVKWLSKKLRAFLFCQLHDRSPWRSQLSFQVHDDGVHGFMDSCDWMFL